MDALVGEHHRGRPPDRAGAVAANREERSLPLEERRVEAVLWMIGIIACCALMLFGPGEWARPVIALFALMLMVIGTMRFGLVPAAVGAFVISLTTALSFAFQLGAFGPLTELPGLVICWTFVAALEFVCLSITALLQARPLRPSITTQRYSREAPSRSGCTTAARCGFSWSTTRRCVSTDGSREEMLSMTTSALLPPGEPQPPYDEPGQDTAGGEPIETLHLTRSGRILEVEVWSRPIDLAGEPAELVFAMDVTERRAFGRALLDAIASEQRRIGQEMHDGLGQELTGLALSARALANRAARERDAIAVDLNELALLATSCIQDARLIVQGLSPLTDADGNLDAALAALARRSSLSGTAVHFHAQHDAPLILDLKTRNHLYRIAQEAVQNALKHAGSSRIDIELSYRDDSVRLAVVDDGRGLPADHPNGAGSRHAHHAVPCKRHRRAPQHRPASGRHRQLGDMRLSAEARPRVRASPRCRRSGPHRQRVATMKSRGKGSNTSPPSAAGWACAMRSV